MTKKLSIIIMLVISTTLCNARQTMQNAWAIVSVSAAFMRQAPDYESALETQLLMGALVEVLETEGYWYKVRSYEPPYEGWVNNLALSPILADDGSRYLATPKYICIVPYSHVYSSKSENSHPISDMVMGNLLIKGGGVGSTWLGVNLPDGRSGWVKRSDVTDFATWAFKKPGHASDIVNMAKSMLGVPYMWGGNSVKAVDCSGLVHMTFFMNRLLLPRNASQMIQTGDEVSVDDMKKGDLVFFGKKAEGDTPARVSHVAICIGGKQIIHASHLVRINSLDPAAENYYEREIVGVRRILGTENAGKGVKVIAGSSSYFVRKSK